MRGVCSTLALAVVAAALGCTGGTADRPPNLLLITLDTTRADRLGCYGNAEAATPNLDRIAGEGVLFEDAVAVTPITLPSHVSLFTGQYPPRHGVRLNGDYRQPGAQTTLAEHLQQQGYSTAAVVAAYVLSADFGIDQGFESYDEPGGRQVAVAGGNALQHRAIVERPAGEVTDAALRLLDGELAEPYFLWLHYYDPHGEYAPPEPFAGRFASAPYDGEIAYMDSELGRLFDTLRSKGQLDRTLLAVTADHGESLGQHGEETHGLFVYDATLKVPLMLRQPDRLPAGTRSARLVSGVDLAPTLLELLEQPPLPGIDGVSFAPAARGQAMQPRAPVYAEAELSLRAYGWAGLYALRDSRRKFIRGRQLELYDLDSDPDETKNTAFDALGDVGVWVQRLGELELTWADAEPETQQPVDAEARAKLAALGYVAGGARPPEREDRPDPGRFVQVHNLLLDVQRVVAQGALPPALELVEKALEVDPENPTALELGGTLLCSLGRCDEGIPRLQTAARLAPYSYQTQHNLGNALHLAGRLPEALAAYRAAVALHPFAGEAHYALGVVLAASGDAAGARVALEQAVDRDPALADAWNHLGILAEKAGDLADAREAYAGALATRPEHTGALFNRAKVCLSLERVDEAETALRRLLAVDPTYPAGHFLEAQVFLAQGNDTDARRALERFLSQDNADPRLIASARELLERLD
jgi:arylsulfatase A-like enzyme/Tfp pilus assembly protein PilF